MDWKQLLTSERMGKSGDSGKISHQRSEYQRDYDRIIFSSPFRRLQNKTQVFPLPGSVFVHNRLTHSLEVSCVGRSLGTLAAEKLTEKKELDPNISPDIPGTIVAAACLAHDLGNPPFGHSGEKAISRYFTHGEGYAFKGKVTEKEWKDLESFEGNANAFRVLTHSFYGRRQGGFALTYATLGALVKYPFGSDFSHKKNKYGYFLSEEEIFQEVADRLGIIKTGENPVSYARHPLVYLVEAADDICYQIMDLEDAVKLKIVSWRDAEEVLCDFMDPVDNKNFFERKKEVFNTVTDEHEQMAYLRASVINKLVHECIEIFVNNLDDIMKGKFTGSLTDRLTGSSEKGFRIIEKLNFEKVYNYSSVIQIELAGYHIIGDLLQEFCGALLDTGSHYSKKILSLIPDQFRVQGDSTYHKIQGVLDYISGMTDLYATELFRDIKGINHKSL